MSKVFIRIFCFKKLSLWLLPVLMSACVFIPVPRPPAITTASKPSAYPKITLEEMVRRHIAKTHLEENSIEGIYTVSGEVIKKSKSIFSAEERERTMDKRNHYATVAIIRNWPGASSEFVEIALTGNTPTSYPIISEISSLSAEQGFIVNHRDRKGKVTPFTFTRDPEGDVLEGVYTEVQGNATITWKLSYLRTYPKNKNVQG
jgi:hypothetical protein